MPSNHCKMLYEWKFYKIETAVFLILKHKGKVIIWKNYVSKKLKLCTSNAGVVQLHLYRNIASNKLEK